MKRPDTLFATLLAILVAVPALASTYVVHPAGTGDFPTIQAAIDAAVDNDVIELTDGTFTGDGNRDIDYLGKAITVRSQSGNPEYCIVDCEASPEHPRRGFVFRSLEQRDSVLEGVTVCNGYRWVGQDNNGGGIFIQHASPTIHRCVFRDNAASGGGGIGCYPWPWEDGIAPRISECSFINNDAAGGGGLYCEYFSYPLVENCTFVGNSGDAGGVFSARASNARLVSCIVAFNLGQAAACVWGGSVQLACSDVYGNEGGDYESCLTFDEGRSGNFSTDPLFCDIDSGDLTLEQNSPCAPGQHPNVWNCGLIGAYPVGCAASAIEEPGDSPGGLLLVLSAPNPFGPSASITYGIPSRVGDASVSLRVYDFAGRLVRALVDAVQSAGMYSVTWDGRNQRGEWLPQAYTCASSDSRGKP